MTPKLDTDRQPPTATATRDQAGDHDVRAFKMFRDAYVTFMDECSRLYHFHCHQLAEQYNTVRERAFKAGPTPTAEDIASIENDFAKTRRERADALVAELQRAVQAYAKGNASAWQAAGEQKDAEWLLWHVGVGQMNAAAAYSSVLAALRS